MEQRFGEYNVASELIVTYKPYSFIICNIPFSKIKYF